MTTQALAAIPSGINQILEPSLNPSTALQAGEIADTAVAQSGFGGLVAQGLQSVNQSLMANQVDLQQLAVGNIENLHQVMIRLEESRMSFQLMMQVRNRLLEGYQDIMKMQV
jgi:flagellar hook-basal body complex protein FliE